MTTGQHKKLSGNIISKYKFLRISCQALSCGNMYLLESSWQRGRSIDSGQHVQYWQADPSWNFLYWINFLFVKGPELFMKLSLAVQNWFCASTILWWLIVINTFPNKPFFLRICSTSLLKTGKMRYCSHWGILPFSTVVSTLFVFENYGCHFHQIKNWCLQTLSVWKSLKFVILEKVNPLLNDKNLNCSKLKQIADDILTLSQTSPGFYVYAVQVFWKHCGKRRNCL